MIGFNKELQILIEKRDTALKIKCERVAAKHQRRIDEIMKRYEKEDTLHR
jgi:hypothetical protein